MSQERSVRTRRLLLRAAAGEFAAHGYTGARLQTVVDRIGMTKGALYGHFASKDDLARAVAAEAARAWEALRGELSAAAPDAGTELRLMAERLVRLMDDDPVFRAAVRLTAEGRRGHPERDLLATLAAHTTALVQRAQDERALSADYPAAVLADLVTAAIFAGARSGAASAAAPRTRLDGLWELLGPGGPRCRPPSDPPQISRREAADGT